jgi:hypothetical protein
MYLCAHDDFVSLNRRGVTVHDVAKAYNISLDEALYACSVLGEHLQYTHESTPHHISVADALDAVVSTRARLEPLPL